MRVAVLSDIHDNIWKLAAAGVHLAGAEAVIFCGDLCSPFTLRRLAGAVQAHRAPVHVVWGNNDGDQRLIGRVADEAGNVTLHGDFAELVLGGLRIAVNHYPEIGRGLAAGGRYDMVCYGHDHKAFEGLMGKTLLLNPGEVMGMNGRSTFAWLDLPARRVQFVEL